MNKAHKIPASYKEAEQELEEIVRALESEALDVDAVAEHVKRAYFLVNFCKKRIQNAQLEISKIEQAFQTEETPSFSEETLLHLEEEP